MAWISRSYDDKKLIAAIQKRRPEFSLGGPIRVQRIEMSPPTADNSSYITLTLDLLFSPGDIDDILDEAQGTRA